ncbi:TetR/AcrR family transcriptional regulator [Actinacidiphila sp. ITFR-21]|uniref:TetR/AcrR family transcriptional regulator n=1 Tax=Actinacidiphila sp. ITFR-21 TaxID=3075199 RepID=UPI00288AD568|nr:TetR/AcrR family transcriptional regulator [Streptomyces sp. ITFR-21]WNI18465.1 TetR/AcrR family transcriptional regulator [Streptomyces sp. ITFR-21]
MSRPRAFDEDTAVRAAQNAFRRTGYAGTSLSDLAEATGLGKGSLYNTFGDKEQLFQRAFGDYCDEADAATDALFTPDAGLSGALGYLRMVTRDALADREHVGCMITKTTSELAVSSPAVVDRASRTLHHAEDLITGALTRARETGETGGEEDPRDLARLLVAITRGIDALGKAGYSAQALRAIEATAARVIGG